MPPPPTSAAPSSAAPSSAAAAFAFPCVALPLLSPGRSLPSSTAEMEASTSRYFRDGQHPYTKRGRADAAAGSTARAAPSSAVSDLVCAEEDARSRRTEPGSGRGGRVVATTTATTTATPPLSRAAPAVATVAEDAATARYLQQLFREPMRCEQDLYRLVDVPHCRRLLAQKEASFREAVASASGSGGDGGERRATAPQEKKVAQFVSCLTAGQQQRYRGFVVEWLRHQPSLSATPNSGDVLKVVQQEQQLFLEALRREAVRRAAPGSSRLAGATTYTRLGSKLTSFAQYRRLQQMQQRLISFLEDAKAKESEGCVLLTNAPPEDEIARGGDAAAATATGEAPAQHEEEQQRAATPLQLFQRRFPSLRVLQWHLAKIYNALHGGAPAPFPNPCVRSHLAAPSTATAASAVVGLPSALPLTSLPAFRRDQADEGERDSKDEAEARGVCPAFAAHLCPGDGGTAVTALSTAALHAHVTKHLLPRLGWKTKRHQDAGGGAGVSDVGSTARVATVSLSTSFEALLKLFVAHVDTDEPRTSFRIPICVRVTRRSAPPSTKDGQSGGVACGVYHAHVMVGDAVPNVSESRHSVQVAAAEHLLLRRCTGAAERAASEGGASTTATRPTTPEAATVAAAASRAMAATVHLTRSGRIPTGHAVSHLAEGKMMGGNSVVLSASVVKAMTQQTTAAKDADLAIVFHVAAPASSVADTAAATATTDASAHSPAPLVVMAKMEHLNCTSAVSSTSAAAATDAITLTETATATPCPWLLEMLSPREMLQLDLVFGCFPGAAVQLHRVQLAETDETGDPAEEAVEQAEKELCMRVLAVESLTRQLWGSNRRHLQVRPAESLITSPTPAEVLATRSWDLLYDTLAWLLDTVARRAAYAMELAEDCDDSAADRFLYLILSNHANLVNTSASSKLRRRPNPEGGAETAESAAAVVAPTYTESRFAVRYVVQDATEIYPRYETKVSVLFEAANLRFLEPETQSDSDGDGGNEGTAATAPEEKESGVGKAASRLYRDPHTWTTQTIPFTFPTASAAAGTALLP
ncbi:hypothetical protein NESM_000662100 [Novymonas esmeraldas]|uniref:Uncharacterized protein n=1 Tax=Novymonas esmeraldas TaxID=1808958 RepID=A0AAW0ET00_9TRYP